MDVVKIRIRNLFDFKIDWLFHHSVVYVINFEQTQYTWHCLKYVRKRDFISSKYSHLHSLNGDIKARENSLFLPSLCCVIQWLNLNFEQKIFCLFVPTYFLAQDIWVFTKNFILQKSYLLKWTCHQLSFYLGII